ncbi:MAG: hypothetical protein R2773_01765 [Flavobacteriaceae bacterium]
MESVKMIWDFYGPNAEAIAKHHEKHLEEFAISECLETVTTGTSKIVDGHYMAFMIVPNEQVMYLREILKPHRGQRYFPES